MNDIHVAPHDLDHLATFSTLLATEPIHDAFDDLIAVAARLVGAADALLVNTYADASQQPDAIYLLDSVQLGNLADTVKIAHCGIIQWVTDHHDVLCMDDVTATSCRDAVDEITHIRSAIGLPILHDEQLLAIWVFVHAETAYFTDYHQQLLTLLSNQLGTTLHQSQRINNLQSQQHQLTGILDAIPDGVLVIDATGVIITANMQALTLLGAERLPDDRPVALQEFTTQGEHIQKVAELIDATADNPLLGRPTLTLESRFDALQTDLFITIALWDDAQRDTYGYVIVWHDETQSRDLVRFKDEMLQLASHDLRSPLNLIVGYADMIALDTIDPNSSVHEHVAVIQKSTRKMNNLLEDLLRIEQIRRTPLELHERINPTALIKVVLVNSRPEADAKHMQLIAEIPDNLPTITADRVLIRQAMENLIHNAIKYTPQAGQVIVRATVEEHVFHFEVEDNGIGIPADKQPYVFEAFYRVKRDTEEVRGTGLGLNLVKTVIESHGGSVYVESTYGEGSRFGFHIPINM